MNEVILYDVFSQHALAQSIAGNLGASLGSFNLRSFPDKETYLQIHDEVKDKQIILLASLNTPNPKLIPLIFFSKTLRELGAKNIILCAPYLAYMRQDKCFHPGEGVTAKYFAELISSFFDGLVTIDPHLHRYHELNEIYSIPTRVLHSADAIAKWIVKNVKNPLLVGPDSESEQWVADIASKSGNCDFVILEKVRRGDKDVEVSKLNSQAYLNKTPVLIDDIASSATTLIKTLEQINTSKLTNSYCIIVHPIFADNAYQAVLDTGVKHIISCNTITHISNAIDLTTILSEGLSGLMSNA
jgi:ribose-phosphate pyrophosphokinase